MSSVAEPATRRQEVIGIHTWAIYLAVKAAYRREMPDAEKERLLKGSQLALAGKVILLDHGYAEVSSQFGTCTYAVQETHCPCPDARRNGDIRCKHRHAARLLAGALKRLARAARDSMPEPGEICPRCGQPTVATVVVWHNPSQSWHRGRLCRLVLDDDGQRIGCDWQE